MSQTGGVAPAATREKSEHGPDFLKLGGRGPSRRLVRGDSGPFRPCDAPILPCFPETGKKGLHNSAGYVDYPIAKREGAKRKGAAVPDGIDC